MTDDDDRTQEIRRDDDRARSASEARSTDRPVERTGNTPPFGAPAAPQQRQSGPQAGGDQRPAQPSGPGYRPIPPYQQVPAEGYAAPMLPTDRGSGGFPAALVGAVIATLLAAGTSYANYQLMVHDVSRDGRTFAGFFTLRLGVLPWPGNAGGDRLTAFLAGLVVVLAVTLLLMMAATMSTRAGTGGFGLFLGAWMSVVIAGAAAAPAVAAILFSDHLSVYLANYVSSGMEWGVLYGWIPGLLLLITHAMRRKPVSAR